VHDGAVRLRTGIATGPLLAWSSPRLRRFAIAHSLAATADALVGVSLAGSLFFSLSADASRGQVLLYLTITMAPFAILAPLVGPLVDRFHGTRRAVAIVLYVIRAGCALGLAITLYDLAFYVLALALLSANKASGVVKHTLIPRLVDDPSQLVAANSSLVQSGAVAGGLGGLVGVAILAMASAPVVLVVAGSVFLMAALAVTRVRLTDDLPVAPASVEYAELHTPSLIVASAGLMALRAGVGYFVFMLAFSLRRASEPPWVYGLAAFAYGAGAFFGHSLAAFLRRRVHEERMMAGALTAAAIVAVVGVLGVNRPTVLAVAAVIGLSASLGRQAFDSLLQRTAPDAMRGRAFTRYETRVQLAWVIGALVATAITLPPEASMAVLAAVFVPVVVVYVRGARDALRFEPAAGQGPLAPAQARLTTAIEWLGASADRHAIIDAAAAADLAVLGGSPPLDDVPRRRMDELRRAALDTRAPITRDDAEEAIALVSSQLGVS
jgi:MFS family permease